MNGEWHMSRRGTWLLTAASIPGRRVLFWLVVTVAGFIEPAGRRS
jgi:hypothetical protein